MDYVGMIFRWAHVLPAVLLGGGLLFIRFCLMNGDQRNSIFDQQEAVRKRWMAIVGLCTLLLLVSGSYNFYSKLVTYKLGGAYHGLFGLKLLLGLAVFYLAAVLAGRSERAKQFRQNEKFWLNILAALVFATVLIGGFMKVSSTDAIKKPQPDPVAATLIENHNSGSTRFASAN